MTQCCGFIQTHTNTPTHASIHSLCPGFYVSAEDLKIQTRVLVFVQQAPYLPSEPFTLSHTPHFLSNLGNLQNASVNRRAYGILVSFQNGGMMHLGMVVGPTDSLTTGSESLHDITMGLFLVAVISRLAGSRWTDDSWQNRPFRGGSTRRRPGEETAFCKFRLFREESGGLWTSLGTKLPLAYMGITLSSPFPVATPKPPCSD